RSPTRSLRWHLPEVVNGRQRLATRSFGELLRRRSPIGRTDFTNGRSSSWREFLTAVRMSSATGDGKSALFAIPMIVLLEVFELAVPRVPALAYTSDVLADARKEGRNITPEIMSCRWLIICIDPEHLMDKQWERITDCQLFRDNIAFMSADEAHLIDEWGEDFRPAFRHIGNFIRGRLPPNVSVSALTATLQPRLPTRSNCKALGFLQGTFHMYRRSNARKNAQFILRPLTHPLGGEEFPDLIQYLASNRISPFL
ncbi:hypothetical protein FB451DRAFT_1450196, partial [Mycena latifolia]